MVVVAISHGKLKGGVTETSNGRKYYEFLSIPFAKPPVGDLRFKSPKSPEPWDDVKDVTVSLSSNASYQPDYFSPGKVMGSEDCLYLNVYTPNIAAPATLPVIFNIHGGGFIGGDGFKENLGPEYFMEHDVVVVTSNYRIGLLGFLNLGVPEASGNMGLKDQVKALEWVQQNIKEFGGNKNNVTIMGSSAGSASVDYLLLSPKAKSLFHKAVEHSGVSINDWAINNRYDELTAKVLDNLEYRGDATEKRKIYEFLLTVPVKDLVVAGERARELLNSKAVYTAFVPSVEEDFGDAFLTDYPYKILKEGRFNKVPVIKGFCEKEGTLAYLLNPKVIQELIAEKNFVKFFSFDFDTRDVNKYNNLFAQAYFDNEKGNEEESAVHFFGDLHFSSGIWISAKMTAQHGVPTYVFQFLHDGDLNTRNYGNTVKGAGHGADALYFFTTTAFPATPNETDLLIRDKFIKMWTDFAETGTPTKSEFTKLWSPFTVENNVFLKIDKNIDVDSNYQPERMAIFTEIYEKYNS